MCSSRYPSLGGSSLPILQKSWSFSFSFTFIDRVRMDYVIVLGTVTSASNSNLTSPPPSFTCSSTPSFTHHPTTASQPPALDRAIPSYKRPPQTPPRKRSDPDHHSPLPAPPRARYSSPSPSVRSLFTTSPSKHSPLPSSLLISWPTHASLVPAPSSAVCSAAVLAVLNDYFRGEETTHT